MSEHSPKAIVIRPYWAGIFATVIAGGMMSIAAYSVNAYAQMEVMKQDVAQLKGINVDQRLTRIETKLDILLKKR